MLEFTIVMLTLDEQLQSQLDVLTSKGYIQVPGTKPQVIYMLCRPASAEQQSMGVGFGKFGIDDRKVHILRDGKLYDVDGKEVVQQ